MAVICGRNIQRIKLIWTSVLFSKVVPYKVLTGFESVDENPAESRYHSVKTL